MLGSGNKSLINKVKMSLDAGCDMVIICNDRSGVKELIEYLDKTDVCLLYTSPSPRDQ